MTKKIIWIQSVLIVLLTSFIILIFLQPTYILLFKTKCNYFFLSRNDSIYLSPIKQYIPYKEIKSKNYYKFYNLHFHYKNKSIIQPILKNHRKHHSLVVNDQQKNNLLL